MYMGGFNTDASWGYPNLLLCYVTKFPQPSNANMHGHELDSPDYRTKFLCMFYVFYIYFSCITLFILQMPSVQRQSPYSAPRNLHQMALQFVTTYHYLNVDGSLNEVELCFLDSKLATSVGIRPPKNTNNVMLVTNSTVSVINKAISPFTSQQL